MNNTATREELKAILDEWVPKYIRQVVELRSGSKLSAERYNELMNLLITQGDDTIELAQAIKQYVELLVDELSNITEDIVEDVITYKISMDTRLEEVIEEVNNSLTEAGDVIKNAAEIYDKVDEINTTTESIIDGTTQVGNAKTLDGHGAEYFAPKTDLANYLNKTTGGTVSNGGMNPFSIKGASTTSLLRYYNSANELQGYLGFVNDKPVFQSKTNTASELLHTGNVGDYAIRNDLNGRISVKYPAPLTLNNTNESSTGVRLDMQLRGNILGSLGFEGEVPSYFPAHESGSKELLHTGNMADHVITKDGGKVNGVVSFAVYDNGYGQIHKSHNATADYGTIITDKTKDDTTATLKVQASENKAYFGDTSGTNNELIHTGNLGDYAATITSGTCSLGLPGMVSFTGFNYMQIGKLVIVYGEGVSNRAYKVTVPYGLQLTGLPSITAVSSVVSYHSSYLKLEQLDEIKNGYALPLRFSNKKLYTGGNASINVEANATLYMTLVYIVE